MESKQIVVQVTILAGKEKAWECYTKPEHITKWNFADPSWHCPTATNDMKIGGLYSARMEAKDGSFGFNFDAIYLEIEEYKSFTYEFGGRKASVEFQPEGNQTKVIVSFDPEDENPLEMQKNGWQSILNNYKNYVETNQ